MLVIHEDHEFKITFDEKEGVTIESKLVKRSRVHVETSRLVDSRIPVGLAVTIAGNTSIWLKEGTELRMETR